MAGGTKWPQQHANNAIGCLTQNQTGGKASDVSRARAVLPGADPPRTKNNSEQTRNNSWRSGFLRLAWETCDFFANHMHATMDLLRNALEMLPRRRLRSPGSGSEQAVLSTKTAATLLCAACSPHMQTGSGGSELPYYGRSPPVYPSRKAFSPTVSAKPAPLTRRRTPKHPAMAPQMSDGLPHTAMPGTWSRS
jgi:hypothetical protein